MTLAYVGFPCMPKSGLEGMHLESMCIAVLTAHRAPGRMDIYLGLRAVHLDPAIWPRADEFLPQRWLPGHEDLAPKRPDAFMPWGLGARMCPG